MEYTMQFSCKISQVAISIYDKFMEQQKCAQVKDSKVRSTAGCSSLV